MGTNVGISFRVMAAFLALTPMVGCATDADPACHLWGGSDEPLCEVSIITLLSKPERFESKLVKVSGYFADGSMPMLFVGRDAADMSDVAQGLALRVSAEKKEVVDRLIQVGRGPVTVIGHFTGKGASTDDVVGYKTGGQVEVIQAGSAPNPWGYTQPIPSLLKLKAEKAGK